MNYKEFAITRPDFSDMLNVRVYKTANNMRKGIIELVNSFDKTNKDNYYDVDGAFCLTVNGAFISYGIIFLCEEFMELKIIIHECLHASFKHDKYINCFEGKYENGHEERLCYYNEWLLIEVLNTLNNAGYKVKRK